MRGAVTEQASEALQIDTSALPRLQSRRQALQVRPISGEAVGQGLTARPPCLPLRAGLIARSLLGCRTASAPVYHAITCSRKAGEAVPGSGRAR